MTANRTWARIAPGHNVVGIEDTRRPDMSYVSLGSGRTLPEATRSAVAALRRMADELESDVERLRAIRDAEKKAHGDALDVLYPRRGRKVSP